MSETQKERLTKYCNGHPYLLQLLKEKAESDFMQIARMTDLTLLDLEADSVILTKLFPDEYERTSDLQKNVLLVVGLSEENVTLKALYEVVSAVHLVLSIKLWDGQCSKSSF